MSIPPSYVHKHKSVWMEWVVGGGQGVNGSRSQALTVAEDAAKTSGSDSEVHRL